MASREATPEPAPLSDLSKPVRELRKSEMFVQIPPLFLNCITPELSLSPCPPVPVSLLSKFKYASESSPMLPSRMMLPEEERESAERFP